MAHVPKYCMIKDCHNEASYWIDLEGFLEMHLASKPDQTFYLCTDHQFELANYETGLYHHLRADNGEIIKLEIGGYSCADDCEVCNE